MINPLDKLTENRELPDGYDSWGIKSVRADLRTRNNFRWPFPGNETDYFTLDDHNDSCPRRIGDGLCVATNWEGMASSGISARTLLLVAYRSSEVRGDALVKFRVPQCFVVDLIDGEGFVRRFCIEADLREADLRRADLRGADLREADLRMADLRGADLQGANLRRAYLQGANLRGADLRSANLQGAYLRGADLQGADLQGAEK